MIQPLRLQGRLPLLAVLAVAVAMLVTLSLARVTTSAGPRTGAVTPSVVATELVSVERRAVVQAPANNAGCGSGAYVSGDMVGDASPAEVYAAMCGSR
jgi:hypothetical protein